ncbi:MAG: hypothetical protein SFY67_00780 [Candidatus Melainabacteria bacterium]|nr:hypothetical protein [Candidatus Melainabacteria bacterium]
MDEEPLNLDQSQQSHQAPVKKKHLTWERTIEIAKLVATVWVALLGSYITFQFNEHQHELNRIEAIAKMLPQMEDGSKKDDGSSSHMGRDGAIWAIFRTANNRTMLRDLAALFPEDIYRVVSSIARTGELDHDKDALVALQVSSEKLAAQYSDDPKHAELASKLYSQALVLRERKANDTSPLRVVELTSIGSTSGPTGDQMSGLISSINNLADQHLKDATVAKPKSTTGHWESKQLYKRARHLGKDNPDEQVQEQVMRADLALASMYASDKLIEDAYKYLKEALEIEAKITGVSEAGPLSKVDKDKNGYAHLPEIEDSIKDAQVRLKTILETYVEKGIKITPPAQAPDSK